MFKMRGPFWGALATNTVSVGALKKNPALKPKPQILCMWEFPKTLSLYIICRNEHHHVLVTLIYPEKPEGTSYGISQGAASVLD